MERKHYCWHLLTVTTCNPDFLVENSWPNQELHNAGKQSVGMFEIFGDVYWVCQVPAHAKQDDLRLIMPPLKGVGLRHGDESEQTQFLTLPPAAPVFATQPSPAGLPQSTCIGLFGVDIIKL